jgi:large repetitive protein
MESRCNGWATHVDGTWHVRGRPPRIRDSFFCLAWLIVFFLFAWIDAAQAQTTYVYDANGRVVAVTQGNSTAEQYTYDTLGHPIQVSAPTSTSQLAIFAFTPTYGVAGTQVTIQGQGFSSSAASNTVSFNGVPATVLSASASQLVVDVPSGASTGPITVTVGGQTVTSSQPFAIDDTAFPPTITQVTPVVAVGGTVTVTGTHLLPIANDTTMQMDGIGMPLITSMADTQMQYTVPADAISGHVTVETPYGAATSAAPVAVLPSSVASQASGAPVTYLTANGSSTAFNTGTAGQVGVLTFDAAQGANLELTLNGMAISGGNSTEFGITVYGPNGSVVLSYDCYSTYPGASCRLPLWNLPAGTYAAVISPQYSNDAISFNAILEPDTIGPALVPGTPTTVNLAAGEVERLTFTANAGDTIALQLAGVNTTPSGQAMYIQVYAPGTVPVATGSGTNYYTILSTTSTGTINLQNLPSTGTYIVVASIPYGTPGSMQLLLADGVMGTVPANGVAQSYQTNEGGQNVYLTFTANQGDNLELTINGLQITGGSTEIGVNVYNASGTNVGSQDCYSSGPGAGCRLALWNLAAGTYSVVVSPQYPSNTLSFNATLEPDTIGPALALSTPTAVSLAAGEVERFTFSANAGDNVALQLSGVSTTPAGQAMYVQVYAPGVVPTANNTMTLLSTAGSTTSNLQNLPATGTYTAIVSIVSGTPGSAQLGFFPAVTGTLSDNGNPQSYQVNASGQNVYLTFSANQGDNLELTINGLQITGGSTEVGVNVYNASGTNVGSQDCYSTSPGGGCRLALWGLAAGTYSVVVSPQYVTNAISFNATLEPDTIGPALVASTPVAVNLAAGEVERFTFNANAGDNIALQLSGVSTTPSGQIMYVQVYAPGVVPTANNTMTLLSATTSTTTNLQSLPATGTYTAIVSIISGTPGSAQLGLFPAVTGALSDDGNAQSYQTNTSGQNVYLSFNANQGDNLELTINGLQITGGSTEIGVNVYDSSGTNVGSQDCYSTSPGAGCRLALWNLAAGTYSVVVSPQYPNNSLSFNATLEPDTIGPALVASAPVSVNLVAGEVERFTFTANAGDTAVVQLSGVSTVPTGQNMYVQVYAPGVVPAANNTFALFDTANSTTNTMQNLPATGTYTVIVSIIPGTPGSAQLTLEAQ